MIASCVGCGVGQLVLKQKNHVGIIGLINGDISSAYAVCSLVVRGGGYNFSAPFDFIHGMHNVTPLKRRSD